VRDVFPQPEDIGYMKKMYHFSRKKNKENGSGRKKRHTSEFSGFGPNIAKIKSQMFGSRAFVTLPLLTTGLSPANSYSSLLHSRFRHSSSYGRPLQSDTIKQENEKNANPLW